MSSPYTTLVKKIFMALTGLFLAFFLIIHLGGNLQLLLPENIAHTQFNSYSHLLSGNPLIKVVSYVLYISILYHIYDALMLAIGNRKANNSSYGKDARGAVSHWASRNMGILGTVILVFLIIHFRDYWYVYKFGALPLDDAGNKDIYLIVMRSFKVLWYVVFYLAAILALGFHLMHGVKSAVRTLGLYNERYIRWVKYFGFAFSFLISLGFAIIPIFVYLKNL
jgi:succinate dehydrogenase / fumarate reductase cytochrome b subunit